MWQDLSLTYQHPRRENGYALKNSSDLVKQMANLQLEDDKVLVSFDVTALFMCTPLGKSLDIILDHLLNDTHLTHQPHPNTGEGLD